MFHFYQSTTRHLASVAAIFNHPTWCSRVFLLVAGLVLRRCFILLTSKICGDALYPPRIHQLLYLYIYIISTSIRWQNSIFKGRSHSRELTPRVLLLCPSSKSSNIRCFIILIIFIYIFPQIYISTIYDNRCYVQFHWHLLYCLCLHVHNITPIYISIYIYPDL